MSYSEMKRTTCVSWTKMGPQLWQLVNFAHPSPMPVVISHLDHAMSDH